MVTLEWPWSVESPALYNRSLMTVRVSMQQLDLCGSESFVQRGVMGITPFEGLLSRL